MDRMTSRQATGRTRRPPEKHPTAEDTLPNELWISPNDPSAWRRAEQRLKSLVQEHAERPLTIGMALCPGSSEAEEAWDLMTSLRQQAPAWHFVLRTGGEWLASMAVIDRVLSGPFQEVQFAFPSRNRYDSPTLKPRRPGDRVLMAIRQLVELRDARQQERPRVVWLQYSPNSEAGETTTLQCQRLARQVGIDRFEVVTTSDGFEEQEEPWD